MCLLAYHILLRKRRKQLGVTKRALLMENNLRVANGYTNVALLAKC